MLFLLDLTCLCLDIFHFLLRMRTRASMYALSPWKVRHECGPTVSLISVETYVLNNKKILQYGNDKKSYSELLFLWQCTHKKKHAIF